MKNRKKQIGKIFGITGLVLLVICILLVLIGAASAVMSVARLALKGMVVAVLIATIGVFLLKGGAQK